LVDGGASVHVENDGYYTCYSQLEDATHFTSPNLLRVPKNEAKGGIVASGSTCLLCPKETECWIRQAHFAHDAAPNLVHVSNAIRDGGDAFQRTMEHMWRCLVGMDGSVESRR
jgi:hypothetical protein